MIDTYRVTQVGVAECDASPRLDIILKANPSLAIDVHVARQLAASGEHGVGDIIGIVEEGGPITTAAESSANCPKLESDLKGCLGRIVTGRCSAYPRENKN